MSELIGKRREELKKIILELHNGKSPEDLKRKFKHLIKNVSAEEISAVEQELIEEGLSPLEIQKLCDSHLEVFKETLKEESSQPEGHPIKILMEEHNYFLNLVDTLKKLLSDVEIRKNLTKIENIIKVMKEGEKHYLREENVLFPILEKHGITQPPQIMWMEHDIIRGLKKKLFSLYERNKNNLVNVQKEFYNLSSNLFDTLSSHFFKENNILFPASINNFSKEEWKNIREEFDKIGYCCIHPKSNPFVKNSSEKDKIHDLDRGKIKLSTGEFSIEELNALFNSLPFDITFIDKEDTVKYFNETKDKIFLRTESILGRKVQLCHPQKSVHIVNKILDEFKNGKREKADFWIYFNNKFIYIRYFPVKDEKGNYLGCVEVTQNITDIKELKGEKRLLEEV